MVSNVVHGSICSSLLYLQTDPISDSCTMGLLSATSCAQCVRSQTQTGQQKCWDKIKQTSETKENDPLNLVSDSLCETEKNSGPTTLPLQVSHIKLLLSLSTYQFIWAQFPQTVKPLLQCPKPNLTKFICTICLSIQSVNTHTHKHTYRIFTSAFSYKELT